MRIQETDRILKESRISRNANVQHHEHEQGFMSRAMQMVSSLPSRITGLFRK